MLVLYIKIITMYDLKILVYKTAFKNLDNSIIGKQNLANASIIYQDNYHVLS